MFSIRNWQSRIAWSFIVLSEKNKSVIYRQRSVRLGRNRAPGGLGPFSRGRALFFPIRISYPVNNIYVFHDVNMRVNEIFLLIYLF